MRWFIRFSSLRMFFSDKFFVHVNSSHRFSLYDNDMQIDRSLCFLLFLSRFSSSAVIFTACTLSSLAISVSQLTKKKTYDKHKICTHTFCSNEIDFLARKIVILSCRRGDDIVCFMLYREEERKTLDKWFFLVDLMISFVAVIFLNNEICTYTRVTTINECENRKEMTKNHRKFWWTCDAMEWKCERK